MYKQKVEKVLWFVAMNRAQCRIKKQKHILVVTYEKQIEISKHRQLIIQKVHKEESKMQNKRK